MKKLFLVVALMLGMVAVSQAAVSFSFGFGVPSAPYYQAPVPYGYVAPQPYYYSAPPAYYPPAVTVAPPSLYFGFGPFWGGHGHAYYGHSYGYGHGGHHH
jgi:hypothetical protein